MFLFFVRGTRPEKGARKAACPPFALEKGARKAACPPFALSPVCPGRDDIIQKLPELLDWYIQAGSQGMTATAGDLRAFMLGGYGVDHLTGGGDNNNWQWRMAA